MVWLNTGLRLRRTTLVRWRLARLSSGSTELWGRWAADQVAIPSRSPEPPSHHILPILPHNVHVLWLLPGTWPLTSLLMDSWASHLPGPQSNVSEIQFCYFPAQGPSLAPCCPQKWFPNFLKPQNPFFEIKYYSAVKAKQRLCGIRAGNLEPDPPNFIPLSEWGVAPAGTEPQVQGQAPQPGLPGLFTEEPL